MHWVLDALMCSGAFHSTGESPLTNLIIKGRHFLINTYVCVQAVKACPKNIRLNSTLLFLFKFQSSKVICEDLWEIVSGVVSLEQFIKIYELATEGDHDCLVIDTLCDKSKRFRKNFDNIIKIQ